MGRPQQHFGRWKLQRAAHQSRPILGEKWKFQIYLKFTLSTLPNYNDQLCLATVGKQQTWGWLIHARVKIEFKILDQKLGRLKLLMDIECKYRTAIGY